VRLARGSIEEAGLAPETARATLPEQAPRPVVLWLDDVAFGAEALALVEHLVSSQDPLPVLLVLTARSEALAQDPVVAARLATTCARSGAVRLHVGPLPDDARADLVRGLLGLDPTLVAGIVARTAGNPLFAVQLVGDWVQRGILEPGPSGLKLAQGSGVELPADLRAVWAAALDGLLADGPGGEDVALEVAAALGDDVDAGEWRDACALAGAACPPGLVGRMVARRLARPSGDGVGAGWAFVHGMLRETVERRSQVALRLERLHRACAMMLASRSGPRNRERRGRHLLAAGDADAALAPLLLGAVERVDAGDYDDARALLDLRERTLDARGAPGDDPRRGEAWVVQSQLARMRGDTLAAHEWAARAVARSGAPRAAGAWAPVRARALRELGRLAWYLGRADAAWHHLSESEGLAVVHGDRALLARVRRDMGEVLLDQGEPERAETSFELALDGHTATGDDAGAASALLGLGYASRYRGRMDEAASRIEQARARYARAGSRHGVAGCWNALGEIARLQGDRALAERLYMRSRDAFAALGSGEAVTAELNLGLVQVEQHRFVDARRTLGTAQATYEARGLRAMQGVVHLCLAACAAGLDDGPGAGWHLEHGASLVHDAGFVDPDTARVLDLTGGLLQRLGQVTLAKRAWDLSATQWEALGQMAEAQAVRARAEGEA
jgi:tetratricopeptide (TPR) repeat protein